MRIVRKRLTGNLEEKEISEVYAIYQSNPHYFLTTHNREAKKEDVKEDILEMPQDISNVEKHYEMIYVDEIPIGVFDYLENFLEKKSIFVGIYMIRGDFHKQGIGKKIFQELEKAFQKDQFSKLRLAVIEENKVAFKFWKTLNFIEKERKTWKERSGLSKTVILMEKNL